MRMALIGNCQASGLAIFLRKALPKWEIKDLPHLGTFYNHISEEEIADTCAWADIVFYHKKHDHPQNYPTKNPKIPLSVWFQSAPFMAQIQPEMWREYYENGGTPEEAVHYDFDYEGRWAGCWARMAEKEFDEGVPESMKMSQFVERGYEHQLQLTCNHPTSLIFSWWTVLICEFLGERPHHIVSNVECISNPNLAGLPCEESATSGARKALGLAWGGRPEDDQSGLEIARKNLNTP